jgi:hypothetical protein
MYVTVMTELAGVTHSARRIVACKALYDHVMAAAAANRLATWPIRAMSESWASFSISKTQKTNYKPFNFAWFLLTPKCQ